MGIEIMNTIRTVFQRVLEEVSGLRKTILTRNVVTTIGHVTVVLDAKMVLSVSPKSTRQLGLVTTSYGESMGRDKGNRHYVCL